MRLSTLQFHERGVQQMQELSARVSKTQEQIASGRRITRPGDDPVASARIVSVNQEITLRQQFIDNTELAESKLVQEESVLQQAIEVLQRARELTIQAGGGAQTATDRRFIAREIHSRFEELQTLLNSQDATGEYLFGGFQGGEQPFSRDGQVIRYHGDEGQRFIQVDSNAFIPVSDSGLRLFVDVDSVSTGVVTSAHSGNNPLGNGTISAGTVTDQTRLNEFFPQDLTVTFNPLNEDPEGRANFTVRRTSDGRVVDGLVNVPYLNSGLVSAAGMEFRIFGQPQSGDQFFAETTNKRGVLQTVDELASGLDTVDPILDRPGFDNLIDSSIANLDNAITSILEVRAEIGARLNTLDSARNLHEEVALQAKSVLSNIRDVDFAAAVSELSLHSFTLEAAQQSFIRVNNLSLFNAL